jgi:hypothetical protein
MAETLLQLWAAALHRLQDKLQLDQRILPASGGVKLHCGREHSSPV